MSSSTILELIIEILSLITAVIVLINHFNKKTEEIKNQIVSNINQPVINIDNKFISQKTETEEKIKEIEEAHNAS
jgi:site-specific DNA-adenine methylase